MPAPRKSPLPAVPGVREGSSAPEGLRAGGREAVLADAGEPHSQPPELRGTDFLFSGHGSVAVSEGLAHLGLHFPRICDLFIQPGSFRMGSLFHQHSHTPPDPEGKPLSLLSL